MMDYHIIFSEEALKSLDEKILPVATYSNGERKVVGSAVLRRVGSDLIIERVALNDDLGKMLKET
jgi:hypothetical protein